MKPLLLIRPGLCREKAPYTWPDWALQPLMPLLALAVCAFLYHGSTRTRQPRMLLREYWSWARVKPWVFRGLNAQVRFSKLHTCVYRAAQVRARCSQPSRAETHGGAAHAWSGCPMPAGLVALRGMCDHCSRLAHL